jgi:hypothetical protein
MRGVEIAEFRLQIAEISQKSEVKSKKAEG